MSLYRINTNINSLNLQIQNRVTGINISKSIEKLGSGYQLNSAADNAANSSIANDLRTQANSYSQDVKNVNDVLGMARIADKAMEEQMKILNLVKTKTIQAAQDSQSIKSRNAIQSDIRRLLEELDNIASSTSFNNKKLLSGVFTNKKFQVGAYSHESVKLTIGATQSAKIGLTRFETGESSEIVGTVANAVDAFDRTNFRFIINGKATATQSIVISTSANTGLGALADSINNMSAQIDGIKASWQVRYTGEAPVIAGDIDNLIINGVNIGLIKDIKDNDSDGRLTAAINNKKSETGIEAYTTALGSLELRSLDGRAIYVTGSSTNANDTFHKMFGTTSTEDAVSTIGRLTIVNHGANDIIISHDATAGTTFGFGDNDNISEGTINLQDGMNNITSTQADAAGFFANNTEATNNIINGEVRAGALTLKSAMMLMDIIEAASIRLENIRGNIGNAQHQLSAILKNVSIVQINIKSSESQIRDLDFAKESVNFSKQSILAQSGGYSQVQASQLSQLTLKVLQ
jgi:flagellin